MTATARRDLAIRADELYSFDQIKQRIGLGKTALRKARRNGLTVRYVGVKGFVLGKDLIEYVEQHARTEK
jgi:hypothetical protein